jgi:hypothetical protein
MRPRPFSLPHSIFQPPLSQTSRPLAWVPAGPVLTLATAGLPSMKTSRTSALSGEPGDAASWAAVGV